jgi:thioester reductase-like protein
MGEADRGTLLTGATGFLGGEVLGRLLERDPETVYVLVRAPSDEEAQRRMETVLTSLFGDPECVPGRVVAIAADVTAPGLGVGLPTRVWLAERVQRIVHCAASVSFGLGLERARASNLEGTRRVLELASLCARRGGLEYLVHVSTAYVSGTHAGVFAEDELDSGQRFRNAYERSKFEAEALVRSYAGSLPVQIVRPSVVVGDSRTGWTTAFNVIYGPLRAFSAGVLAVIPGRRSAPVDVVPVDYVADAILALRGRPGTTYHLAAGERASTIDEVIELASAYTGRRPPRVLPPRLYRRAVHPVLVRSGPKKRRRVLRSSEPLFPYFATRARFDTVRARAALAPQGIEPPPLPTYFERLMAFAEEANWGHAVPARHEAESAIRRASRRPAVPEPAWARRAA